MSHTYVSSAQEAINIIRGAVKQSTPGQVIYVYGADSLYLSNLALIYHSEYGGDYKCVANGCQLVHGSVIIQFGGVAQNPSHVIEVIS